MTLLPLLYPVDDPVLRREKRDRLEVLTALINAPGIESFYREDVITVPPDHPAYAWECVVPGCEAQRTLNREMCAAHLRQWGKVRADGGMSWHQFARTATPTPRRPPENAEPAPCRICLTRPSFNHRRRLCHAHVTRWYNAENAERGLDFEYWLTGEGPLPGYGECAVPSCTGLACDPLGLCTWHRRRYRSVGTPGQASLPSWWFALYEAKGRPVPVRIESREAFDAWCSTVTCTAGPGQVDLRGLPLLVQAEIRWGMIAHARRAERTRWLLHWIQETANLARRLGVGSIYDEDMPCTAHRVHQVVRDVRQELQLVYLTTADTRESGFLHTEHFGVRFKHRDCAFDLTRVSQRWLRDLLWDEMAEILQSASPPRTGSPLDQRRRACVELSAFLEATCADGGHDPRQLTGDHMLRFVADQRRRARDRLPALGLRADSDTPSVLSEPTRQNIFNNARRILRKAMDSGVAEQIGLGREFITALPHGGGVEIKKRRPFPDDVARALADKHNLQLLAEVHDPNDNGLREMWETLVATGRRATEVLDLRLECLGRYGGVPMLWHDQTKVGHLDAAIRIPEAVYDHLQERQRKTLARFEDRFGEPATPDQRQLLALFPSRVKNPRGHRAISYTWFHTRFSSWVGGLDVGRPVPHQARHTLATNLLRHGAGLHHIKKYLGQVSIRMAEHYAEVASSELDDILQQVWVAGPGAAQPGTLLAAPTTGMEPAALQAMAIDLSRHSTPAEGGFCTYQPVVRGEDCPWKLNCEGCDKFVLSGADLLYWRRKQEQWRSIAERAPDDTTADYLHQVFEPTARAIDGLEKALAGLGLLDQALALDYRRPQDYFHRLWTTAFRTTDLAQADQDEPPGTEENA